MTEKHDEIRVESARQQAERDRANKVVEVDKSAKSKKGKRSRVSGDIYNESLHSGRNENGESQNNDSDKSSIRQKLKNVVNSAIDQNDDKKEREYEKKSKKKKSHADVE